MDEEILAVASAITPEAEVIATVSKSDSQKYLRGLNIFLMQSTEDRSEALQFRASIEQKMEVENIQSCITSHYSV